MSSKNKEKKKRYKINKKIKKEETKNNININDYKLINNSYIVMEYGDIYNNRYFPNRLNNNQIVDGNILYYRIGLKYKNKYYIKERNMKEICNIYIHYLNNDNQKEIFKINLYDFYKYLIKEYEKNDVINYIKSFCKKFEEPIFEEYNYLYDYYINYKKTYSFDNIKSNDSNLDFSKDLKNKLEYSEINENIQLSRKNTTIIEIPEDEEITKTNMIILNINNIKKQLPLKINIFNKYIKERKDIYCLKIFNLSKKTVKIYIKLILKLYKELIKNNLIKYNDKNISVGSTNSELVPDRYKNVKKNNIYKFCLYKIKKEIIVLNTKLKYL